MSTNEQLITAEKHEEGVLIASRSLDSGWQDVVISVDQAIDLISELQAATRTERVQWFDDDGDQVAMIAGYTLYAYATAWSATSKHTTCVGRADNINDAKQKAIAYVREQLA